MQMIAARTVAHIKANREANQMAVHVLANSAYHLVRDRMTEKEFIAAVNEHAMKTFGATIVMYSREEFQRGNTQTGSER